MSRIRNGCVTAMVASYGTETVDDVIHFMESIIYDDIKVYPVVLGICSKRIVYNTLSDAVVH